MNGPARCLPALLLLLAGCASAPPPPPERHAEEAPSDVLDSALVDLDPSGLGPGQAPGLFAPPCTPDTPARPFLRQAYGWIAEMAPLLGCSASSLADEAWGVSRAHPLPSADRALRRYAPPEASGITVAVFTDEDKVERITMTLTPDDPRRVAQLFRNQAEGLREYLFLVPLAEDDRNRIYPPTEETPFAVGLYRSDRSVSVQVAPRVGALRVPPPEASLVAASPSPLACTASDETTTANALFDPTPTTWVPLAPRLLGCSPEAIAALSLGEADTTRSTPDARIETFARSVAGRQRLLVVVYGPDGVTGVSAAEEVPTRLGETIFDLRSSQVREVTVGEPASSPPGTLVFPASGARPYGVRLALSPPFLILSVIRES